MKIPSIAMKYHRKITYSYHSSFHMKVVVYQNIEDDKAYKRAPDYQSIHFQGSVPSRSVITELKSHRYGKRVGTIYKGLFSSPF